jgi:hypothetical protein
LILPSADTAKVSVAQETEEALPEVELRREPEILFHERVTAGEPNELIVTLAELTQQDPGTQAHIEFALSAGQESVTVNVLLSATGFDVTPDSAPMTVARKRDEKNEQAKFTLTARDVKEPVPRAIHADFLLGTSVIGAVTHFTCVMPKNYAGNDLPCQSQMQRAPQGFAVPRNARREAMGRWLCRVRGRNTRCRSPAVFPVPPSTSAIWEC